MRNYLILCLLILISLESAFCQKSSAGFMSIQFVDSSRIYKPNTTLTDSLHYRPVDLDIWYPSGQKENKPLIFEDLFKLFEQRAVKYQDNANYSGLTSELAQYYVAELGVGSNGQKLLEIKTSSFANLKPSPKSYPIILYMAGFNGMGFENYKVLEDLAQNGFIVISIWSVGRYPGDMTNEMEDMLEQVNDADFALKYLSSNKTFNGDFKNIGILGCSWGGMSAAVFVERHPDIKAMVSYDGTETHYFGETDINAEGENNDQFIQTIHKTQLLHPENDKLTYLYFESGDKLNGFVPTSQYNYYRQLNSEKYYLRFPNSTHADFLCIPSILNSSKNSVEIYESMKTATVNFFTKTLKDTDSFSSDWENLVSLDFTTTQPYEISKNKGETLSKIYGQVIDSNTHEPLSYVSIGVLNREIGTVTNNEGQFHLSIKSELKNDTIRISSIGYNSVEFSVKDLIEKDKPLTIELFEQINELNEVVIRAKLIKKKTLGNKTESRFISTALNYEQLGAEIGIKINISHVPTFVDAFNFSISYNRLSAKSIFRVNFYTIKNGNPFDNILTKNILVPIEPKQTGLITVDLKPYNIILSEDVIVTLEWVYTEGENNKGEAIFFPLGLFTNGTIYKKSSQSGFKKYSNLGVGFNIDVRY